MAVKKGFTLPEVLVSILIFGLTLGALLNFLRWGHTFYIQLVEGWQIRSYLNDFRLEVRKIITSEEFSLPSRQGSLSIEALPRNKFFKTLQVKIRKAEENTFFVSGNFFLDKNQNNEADPEEDKITRTWVFRRRSGV